MEQYYYDTSNDSVSDLPWYEEILLGTVTGGVGGAVSRVIKKGFDDVVTSAGKYFAKGTGKGNPANIGTSYGKNGRFGTVVENPNLQPIGFSGHAVNQAINRGVKTEAIHNTIKNPVAVLSQQGGNRFAYVSQDAVVVLDKKGNIVTIWGKDTFDYVVKQVLKDAVK